MVALFIVNSKMKERIGFLGKPLSHFITIGRYFKRLITQCFNRAIYDRETLPKINRKKYQKGVYQAYPYS